MAACILRLFFWFYTNRTWEDALITVLHSENFARGLGLTHRHPGYPPLHGFISPFSVLVPLPADLIHPGWGLVLLRLVSAFLAIPTILLAAAIALHRPFYTHIWLVAMLCGYLAFEHHQILWGMAGMETQIAVFVLFLTMYCALEPRTVPLGIAMACCVYARPDFAIFLLVVAVYLWFTSRRVLFRAGALAFILYTPWLIFTTVYYGSPIPNTIIAKSVGYHHWLLDTPLFSVRCLDEVLTRVYDFLILLQGPTFAGHGTGFQTFRDEGFLARLAIAAAVAGVAAMLCRLHRFYILPLGFLAAYTVYYVFAVQVVFGWYLVPFHAIVSLVLVLGLSALFQACVQPARIPLLSRTACAVYLLPFLVVLPLTFRAERGIQLYVETPVRIALGRYLFEHKKPGDRVGCEPLGYISYYSRMPVYDYPGLASPEVTAFIRQHPECRSLDAVLAHVRPEWIALRESEYKSITSRPGAEYLGTGYTLEKTFRADPVHAPQVNRIDHNIDQVFLLFRKRPAPVSLQSQ